MSVAVKFGSKGRPKPEPMNRLPVAKVKSLQSLREAKEKANAPFTAHRLATADRAIRAAEAACDAAAVSIQHYRAFSRSALSGPSASAGLTVALRESLRAQARNLRAAAAALSGAAG